MGFVSNSRGVGSCVSGTPSFVGQSDSYVSDKEKFRLLPEEVQSLLLKRVIEEIPLTQSTPGFYSRLFLVPKKTGGMRPVIDFSILNSYLSVPHFKMETNRSIRACILPGMLTTKLDLSDAYFHIPISLASRKISPICLEQQGLPISGGPVWPGGCTTGFYSGFSDGYSSPAYSVDSSSFLSGRFSSEGIRLRNSFSSYLPVYQTSSGPRLPYFLEKVSDTAFPRLPVFWGNITGQI